MAWIESHQSLLTHRKTMAAAALLKVDRHKLIGHLMQLWWWALDNVPSNGSTDGIPDEALAAAAGWTDKRDLIGVLREVGFLDANGLHNWDLYGGKVEEKRAADRERKRRHRADVARMSDGHPAERPMEVAGREEKSREEKSREDKTTMQQQPRENAFALYESIFNVPIPNAIVADKILAAEAESGAECLRHCLEEAALNEARSWKYVEVILARHRAEGCGPASTAAVAADEDFINRRRELHEAKAAAS